MSEHVSPSSDDAFAAQLEACERLLDTDLNGDSTLPPASKVPAEAQQRLARGLAAVRRLKRLWPSFGVRRPDAALHGEQQASADAANIQGGVEPPHSKTAIGRFEVVRELGRGGCGVVFLAYDPTLKREVALKVPRAEALVNAELRERFQQEARAAGALDHPNIVPVYEAGAVGPVCYIASAYCPGVTLADWLKGRTEPMPFLHSAALVATLAEAVQHAHERGVLHRDLKPSNILLSRLSTDSTDFTDWKAWAGPALSESVDSVKSVDRCLPKITDFGLAKLMDAGDVAQTHTGAILGTPSYMAPEQAQGHSKAVGVAADIYSLGAILYELLTGRPPFQGDSPLETLQQVQTAEPLPPSRLRYSLPRDLQTICLKCLEKEPGRRYATAGGLAEDLHRFRAGQPIRARATSWLERGLKSAKRRPAVASLLAGIVSITAVALVVVTWQWQQTELARQAEEAQRKNTEATLAAKLIALAHLEWERGNLKGAKPLLRQCLPEFRNDEWRFVHWACHAELASTKVPAPPRLTEELRVICSADSRCFASFSALHSSAPNQVLTVHDMRNAEAIFTIDSIPTGIDTAAFSSDGQKLLILSKHKLLLPPQASLPATVYVWEVATRRPLANWALPVHPSRSIMSANGERLAVDVYQKNRIGVYDTMTGQEVRTLSHGHRRLQLSADGRLLLGGSTGFTAKELVIRDLTTGNVVHRIPEEKDSMSQIVLAPDGEHIAWTSTSLRNLLTYNVTIWNLRQGRPTASLKRAQARDLAFSPDGKRLALAGPVNTIELLEVETGKQIISLRGHQDTVTGVAFSPDGKRLVSGSLDGTIKIWTLVPPDVSSP
jgi:serine/threonine protein kinase